MKISELIQKLEALRSTHGDIRVCTHTQDYGMCEITLALPYESTNVLTSGGRVAENDAGVLLR